MLGALTGSKRDASVCLSPLGEAVEQAWLRLPDYYPELTMLAHQVMPDHLHGIIFVERELQRTTAGAGTAEPMNAHFFHFLREKLCGNEIFSIILPPNCHETDYQPLL